MSIDICIEGSPMDQPDEFGWAKPTWPWMNMSNQNAEAIFLSIGMPLSKIQQGVLEAHEIPPVIQEIIKVVNLKSKRKPYYRRDYVEEHKNKARYVSKGIDDSYIVDRLEQFLELLKKAQQEGARVFWG